MPSFSAFDHFGLLILISICVLSYVSASGEWEYEAVYKITEHADTYSINLANNADSTMKFCFSYTDEASSKGIEHVEMNCAINNAAVTINPFAAATMITSNQTYQLNMDSNTWLSVFNIQFPVHGLFAFFGEHDPSEFYYPGGTEMEILKDSESHDVAASFVGGSRSSSKASDDSWRDTMLGCLAVWAITLSGLILIVNMSIWELIKPYASMFASGTLISTAFCLVLYESTHLITDQSATESLAAGKWASMVLVGFLSSPICRLILQSTVPAYLTVSSEEDIPGSITEGGGIELANTTKETDADTQTQIAQPTVDKEAKFSILFAMLVGDFFHNFADGIFIGSAFQCNASFAWKMVGITVAHELSQELGDFSILTGSIGCSTRKAILYNVISGMSVMLGGIVVLSQDLQSNDIGMLLSYGAGNYLYAATVHLFKEVKDTRENGLRLLFFCVGAISIGLILLDHEHCSVEPTYEGDASEHNH